MSSGNSLSLRQEAMLRANRTQLEQSYSDDEDDSTPPVGYPTGVVDSSTNSIASTVYGRQQYSSAPYSSTVSEAQQHAYNMPPPVVTQNNHFASTPIIDTQQDTTVAPPSAESARQEWRQYGVGATQVLEEKRRVGPLVVRVASAQERVDVSGAHYTTYAIHVQDRTRSEGGEFVMEHRYSEFNKLCTLIQQQSVTIEEAKFPHKHWAGRVGQWTPSKQWAPEKHQALVQYRTTQLDVWLVHVVARYNQQQQQPLPSVVQNAIHDFLFVPPRRPCDRVNPVTVVATDGVTQIATTPKWQWNNPFSATLGSAIRQAACTVQYMCAGADQKLLRPDADQSIPLDLLQAAQGLCFMTVVKAGLVVTGRFGTGLVISRLPPTAADSRIRWSAPVALATAGVGWGAQAGGDVTHYLIVLTTPKAVQDMVSSSSVTLGAELGVAVGPIGRGAHSQVQTGDWALHSAYSYAHSQGLFVGISLEGSVVRVRDDVNAKFYGQACNAPDLLRQGGPTAAQALYDALDDAMSTEIKEGAFRPSELFSPGRDSQASAAESWKNSTATPNANTPTNNSAMGNSTLGLLQTVADLNSVASLADATTPRPS